MTLQNQILTLINTNGFRLPLEILEINKYCYTNIVIQKKFKLNINNFKLLPNIKNITQIIMSDNFNEFIKLPKELKYIKLGRDFNQKIIFPENLEKIKLGNSFNQLINLPNKLKNISFAEYFYNNLLQDNNYNDYCNDYIDNVQNTFNQVLEFSSNIEKIKFNNINSNIDKIILPKNLLNKSITIRGINNTKKVYITKEDYNNLDNKNKLLLNDSNISINNIKTIKDLLNNLLIVDYKREICLVTIKQWNKKFKYDYEYEYLL
jgi:hypothetical protein